MSDNLEFNDKDPIESLAALLTIVLAKRNPDVKSAQDISMDQIEEAKGWATDLFYALLALNYRIVRIPQNLDDLIQEGI